MPGPADRAPQDAAPAAPPADTARHGLVGLHDRPPWPALAQLALGIAFWRRQGRVAAPLLQTALFANPVDRRAALMPAGLALAVTIALAGRLADRAPLRRTLAIGLLVMAATFAVMVGVGSATAVAWLTLWAVLGRIGLGLVIPSLSLSAMRAIATARVAAGTGTMNFVRQLGGAVGVDAVGIGLEWRLQATQAAAGSAGTLRAFHEVFVLMALVTAAAAVAAWQMRPAAAAGGQA